MKFMFAGIFAFLVAILLSPLVNASWSVDDDDDSPDEPSCCSGKPGSTSAPSEYPESDSPAGGPSNNPNAAVCYLYRPSNCVVCKKGSATQKCCTETPYVTDDTKEGGPTPYNEYLIGLGYINTNYNKPWHKLYPKKHDNSGYWDYFQENEDGRDLMGFHPGTVSEGCVTVKTRSCWDELDRVLSSGDMTYRTSGHYDGFLYVVEE